MKGFEIWAAYDKGDYEEAFRLWDEHDKRISYFGPDGDKYFRGLGYEPASTDQSLALLVMDILAPVVDPAGFHTWIPSQGIRENWFIRLAWNIPFDFGTSMDGRYEFLLAMHEFNSAIRRSKSRICSFDFSRDIPTINRITFFLYVYSVDDVKPDIQYLARCQMARCATERALKHQGIMHKDLIPLIGNLVWESRWEDEWK